MPREETTYRGTVTLISGITQNSKKDKYPLVHADDVQVGNDESYRLTDYVDSHDNIINGSGDNSLQHMPEGGSSWDNSNTTNPYLKGKNLEDIVSEYDKESGESATRIALNNGEVLIGAFGENSTMWNTKSQASGGKSHAEGSKTIALSNNAHAEGNDTFAGGKHSHAEGNSTAAVGNGAHSEGHKTQALGAATHAEGEGAIAEGQASHSEGHSTIAIGESSHAEGYQSFAFGAEAHAEGNRTSAGTRRFEIKEISIITQTVESNLNESVYEDFIGIKLETFEGLKQGDTVSIIVNTNQILENIGKIRNFDSGYCVLDITYIDGIDNYNNISGWLFVKDNIEDCSHAEGCETQALGNSSHAEGYKTKATGDYSHVEGYGVEAWGEASHIEGRSKRTYDSAMKEANMTIDSSDPKYRTDEHIMEVFEKKRFSLAKGDYSHVEGVYNLGLGIRSHAEGSNTIAKGEQSHTEGYLTVAKGANSHAEGNANEAWGVESHIEGYSGKTYDTAMIDAGKVVEKTDPKYGTDEHIMEVFEVNRFSLAKGDRSHVEGQQNLALAKYTHAEGLNNIAKGESSHAEGGYTKAIGNNSHTEGSETYGVGKNSHAEGLKTTAKGDQSHAEGYSTQATGLGAHAEGYTTEANGIYSHAEGNYTIASGSSQHVQGKFNVKDTENKYAHIVGGGTSDNNRKNIHTIDWDGNAEFLGEIYVNTNGERKDLNKLVTREELDNKVASIVDSAPETLDTLNELAAALNDNENFGTAITNSLAEIQNTVNTKPGIINEQYGEVFNDYSKNEAGSYAHAEGWGTKATGEDSHAEGHETVASGLNAHAEACGTIASGDAAHAEGLYTVAEGEASHAQNRYSEARIDNSHAEGVNTLTEAKAYRLKAIAATTHNRPHTNEDGSTIIVSETILDTMIFNEGTTLIADGVTAGMSVSAITPNGKSSGIISKVKDETTLSIDISDLTLIMDELLTENCQILIDNGKYGNETFNQLSASAEFSSHAEGTNTTARLAAHAEGVDTEANGFGSHAEGIGTITNCEGQHVQGRYNEIDSTKALIVGNGTSKEDRKNIYTLDWEGNAEFAGDIYAKQSRVLTEESLGHMPATPIKFNNKIIIDYDGDVLFNSPDGCYWNINIDNFGNIKSSKKYDSNGNIWFE